jgi:GNAT superfamily N-acetyltransferase
MLIEPVDAQNFESVLALLTAAFVDDPVCRYLYPDLRQYFSSFPEFLRIFAEPGLALGSTHLAQGLGAAIWVPPGTHADAKAVDDLIERSTNAQTRAELLLVYAEFDRACPPEPHWYLPLMGVDPLHFGKGIGAALMTQGLGICDREGSLAYLESTKPCNVPFYERFGFVPYGKIDIGSHPPVTTMIRRPR